MITTVITVKIPVCSETIKINKLARRFQAECVSLVWTVADFPLIDFDILWYTNCMKWFHWNDFRSIICTPQRLRCWLFYWLGCWLGCWLGYWLHWRWVTIQFLTIQFFFRIGRLPARRFTGCRSARACTWNLIKLKHSFSTARRFWSSERYLPLSSSRKSIVFELMEKEALTIGSVWTCRLLPSSVESKL